MKIKILAVIIIILVMILAIKHVAVKSSGDRGLASEWNDDHHIDSDVECNQHQHLQHIIENRTDWPAGPVKGQIIYRTDLNAVYIWDGTHWTLITLGVSYWSCPGASFMPANSIKEALYGGGYYRSQEVAGNIWLVARVFLPHGAIVTGAVVYGSDGTRTWDLKRVGHAGAIVGMASALVGVEDVTIDNAVVDNENWAYFFQIEEYPWNKVLWCARITYIL